MLRVDKENYFNIPAVIQNKIKKVLEENFHLQELHKEWVELSDLNTADWNALNYILDVELQ